MTMPCNKCLENNWDSKFIDGYVIATCRICDNEIEFKEKIFDSKRHKENYERKVAKFSAIKNWKRKQKSRLDYAIKLQEEERKRNFIRRQKI